MPAKRHITLVWVGLPIMRREDLNTGATYLDAIYADEVQHAGGTFLPLIDTYKGPDGGFAAYGPGVEFCVVGLDRNWAYNPACKAARP